MQFALKWRLQDSILRFKVNWSLSQSCIVFVLVLILLFVLSVWVFSSWLCTVLNGWSATEPRIDVLPGGLAVRMGPWAALPSPKKSPPEMHSRKHTWIRLGAVLLPISRSAIWTTLNQGKTDFQGRPSHFVDLFDLKQRIFVLCIFSNRKILLCKFFDKFYSYSFIFSYMFLSSQLTDQ